jgi:hypothetical protein
MLPVPTEGMMKKKVISEIINNIADDIKHVRNRVNVMHAAYSNFEALRKENIALSAKIRLIAIRLDVPDAHVCIPAVDLADAILCKLDELEA